MSVEESLLVLIMVCIGMGLLLLAAESVGELHHQVPGRRARRRMSAAGEASARGRRYR